nr:rRNA maturation RNase YbeY [Lachnospiraceae bacterium]
MTFCVERETEISVDFSPEELFEEVAKQVLTEENCPYEAEINLLLTDSDAIRVYNREYRDIDKETDVLSFPGVDYETPSDFSLVEQEIACYVNPDTQELMLGDIILNMDRVISQAKEYGHSEKREFAFLITHSMLHLLGYDHMTDEEEKVMFQKQEQILDKMGIFR